MKQTKQRVIALDYFRGVCLLLVLVNHSVLFSMPFALWTGAGGLWTSAAEMFLLLSGITYGIVRGDTIKHKFKAVLRKTWRRAAIIYSIDILVVFTTLLLALFLSSHNLTTDVNGTVSNGSPLTLIANILTFRYSVGWANFLMYFSVFLVFAPFLLYTLRTRFWAVVPIVSFTVFAAHFLGLSPGGVYGTFLSWQVYFVLGLVIGRFRNKLLSVTNSLSSRTLRTISYFVVSLAVLTMTLSYLLEHSIYPTVSRLANDGWLPVKAQAAYIHILGMRAALDNYLLDDRNGLARPFVSLLVATAVYIVYRRYGKTMLDRSGKFFLALGKDSLWIFVGQAAAIPLIAVFPVNHHRLLNNLVLTSTLVFSMWMITKRHVLIRSLRAYGVGLQEAFYEAKYVAMFNQKD